MATSKALPYKRIRHPYHLKKLYSNWQLKLLAHPHTGKLVHHQHTSYPLLALLLLVVAATLAVPTLDTYASGDVLVSAVVSGPVPTVAATIDSPTEGQDFSSTPTSVSGTCPLDSFVQLFRNNYPSGTAYCSSQGTYSISSDLFKGANALVVRDYNLAGTAGPDSQVRNVTYTPPVVAVTPPVQGTSGGSSSSGPGESSGGSQSRSSVTKPATVTQPLTLHNDYVFQGFSVGESASWKVAVAGGVAPYSINVEWGDGSTALYTSTSADTLTLTHTYTEPGPNSGSYEIIVTASDAAGNQADLQIAALIVGVNNSASSTTAGSSANRTGAGTVLLGLTLPQAIGAIWGTLVISGAFVASFWFGEVHQLRILHLKYGPKKS